MMAVIIIYAISAMMIILLLDVINFKLRTKKKI